jgi:hypothetical protein
MNEIHVDLGPYFTFNLRVFGILLIISSVSVPLRLDIGLVFYLFIPMIILAGLGLIRARKKAVLNLEEKYFLDYVVILWVKNGDKISFEAIDLIYINEVQNASNFQSRGRSMVIRGIVYKAFLLLSNGQKVRLDEDKNYYKLLNRVAKYNELIKTQIQDNTSS